MRTSVNQRKLSDPDFTYARKVYYYIMKKSRKCGKGVGLGLFPSDSLESQSYHFDKISHIGP